MTDDTVSYPILVNGRAYSASDVAALVGERDQARAERDAWRRDWQAELDGGAELRKHLGAQDSETLWGAADRVVAERLVAQAELDLARAEVARLQGVLDRERADREGRW